MLIKNLKLKNYRNYKDYNVRFNKNLNIIVGENGIGKTNALESIMVVSNSKSFRTNNDQDLILKGEEFLAIELQSETNNFKVVINQKAKSLYIDDNPIKKTSDFIGKLNAVLFKPSDLELFNDAPSERRKILDLEISKVNKEYLRALLKYNSLLKDKNKLLKEIEIDHDLLNVIEESMIPAIQTIIEGRESFINKINKRISDYYEKISGVKSEIKVIYKKCCDVNNIKQELQEHKTKDEYYHYATFGPHHEDFYFTMGDYELNSIASQGQKRMTLIAFKFALIEYIQESTGTTPIVLLDDVLSELDKNNKERLLNNLPKDAQVILTNTDIRNLQIDKEFKLINLKEDKDV